jgi:leucyl-tRNA synthetase
VNGKLRAHLQAAFGTPNQELQTLALALDKVKPFVDGKQIAKVIVVPDKLINLVVK